MSKLDSHRIQVRVVQFPLVDNSRLHSPVPRPSSVLFSATCRPPPCRFLSRTRKPLHPAVDCSKLRPLSAKSEEVRLGTDWGGLRINVLQSRMSSREGLDDSAWGDLTIPCGFSNERLKEIVLFDESTSIRLNRKKHRSRKYRPAGENDENKGECRGGELDLSTRTVFRENVKPRRTRSIIKSKPITVRTKPTTDFSFLRIQKIETECSGRLQSTPRVNTAGKTAICCSDTQTDPLNVSDFLAIEETSQDEKDSPIRRQFF